MKVGLDFQTDGTVRTALLHSVTISYFHCSYRMASSVVFTIIMGLGVVILALKCVPALFVRVTRSARVCGGSYPVCSEERTSNIAQVLATIKTELVSAANQVANPL